MRLTHLALGNRWISGSVDTDFVTQCPKATDLLQKKPIELDRVDNGDIIDIYVAYRGNHLHQGMGSLYLK